MRKVLFLAVAIGSIFVIHCSSSSPTNSSNLNPLPSSSSTPTTGTKTSGKTKTPPPTTTTDTTPKPTKATPDAGTKTSGPGANCQDLSTCCSKISNSAQQTSCLQIAGKANEQACTAAETKFQCSSLATAPPTRGPSCAGLTSGALYCGDDGPKGDPSVLYRCTGTTIAIERVCLNGCTSNPGVDDSCSTTATTPPASTASCKGLSGDYCGTDFVGGNANTLYSCANDAIAQSTVCPNGCNINPDATLNDTCADAPATTTVDCTGFPDSAYCGLDLGGDEDTLYTCSGGDVLTTQKCTNGCTIAAPNVSDFCTSTTDADCTDLTDGFYCGTNGVMGDPNTLYTCQDGTVMSNPTVCTFGCIAGDFGGDDQCNGGG